LAAGTVNGQAVTGTTTSGFTMVAGSANRFAFTSTVTGNQTVSTSAGVGPFAVQVQDSFGNPVTNTGTAVTLTVSTNSAGLGHTPFFTTTSGGTTASSVTIANGSSTSANFYYSDTKAGTPTITLGAGTVNGQAVTGTTTSGFTMVAGSANRFGFTSTVTGNQTVSTSAGVGPFAVQVQDSFGNPVTNTGTAVTLSVATNSAGLGHTLFFTTTSGGTTASSVTIPNGSSTSANFYYSDTKVGTPTITLAAGTVNGQAVTGTTTSGFTMVAGSANSLSLSAATTTPAAGAADNLT